MADTHKQIMLDRMRRGAKGAVWIVASVIMMLGKVGICAEVRYGYDDRGRLGWVMDESGSTRIYSYDASGNIVSVEAGDGGCPAVAPTVTSITPGACKAGTTCQITIGGGSLMGGAIRSSLLDAAVTHCRELACGTITCRIAPGPFMPPGAVGIRVTTALGFSEGAVQINPPPGIDQSGQAEAWHFAASLGQTVTLRMTRVVNQQDGSSSLDPIVELRDSRGYLLAQDDESGSSQPPGPGRNAVIQNFTLPATDTYNVVARGRSGTSGTYALEIEPSTILLNFGPEQPTEPAFTFAGTVSATIPVSPPPTFSFQGAIATTVERDTHTFPANSGTIATIEVDRTANQGNGSGTLDPAVELRDSRGFLLRQDNDTGSGLPPGPGHNALVLNHALPATDTYAVVVAGANGTTGPYEVKVVFGELTVASETDTHTFPANGGTIATIRATRVVNASDGTGTLDPSIELRDSRGFLLGRDDDTGTDVPPGPGRNALIPRLPLAATDTYSLSIRGANGSLGPYTIEVFFEN